MKDAEASAGRPVPPAERDAVYRGLLDRVILFRLLASEAKVRGITVTPQEVTERIAPDQAAVPERGRVPEGAHQAPHDDGRSSKRNSAATW